MSSKGTSMWRRDRGGGVPPASDDDADTEGPLGYSFEALDRTHRDSAVTEVPNAFCGLCDAATPYWVTD